MSCHDAFHGQGRGKSKKSTEMEKFRLRIQLLAVHCRIRHPIALPVSMPSTHPLRRDRGPRALMLYAVGRHACCAMMSAYSHRVSHVCAASKGGRGLRLCSEPSQLPAAPTDGIDTRHFASCWSWHMARQMGETSRVDGRGWRSCGRGEVRSLMGSKLRERRRASSLPQG
ncbi:uncharacterized protein BKA78DRAFT_305716, partial [Phyllosticta capitalensis]|uniref:uncharacterized protein n=1 Tax=Phyllosticta capitalensis TaxID=121624 RepID=UPI00312E6179